MSEEIPSKPNDNNEENAEISEEEDASAEEYSVEKIVDKKIKKGKVHYFIKWMGYSE